MSKLSDFYGQVGGGEAADYVRPSDWLDLPVVDENSEKFVGLYAVFEEAQSNYVSTRCAAGHTIDWGDGTIENYSSYAIASHQYDYDDLAASSECSRGYKQAIITITPQSGQSLTAVDIQKIHASDTSYQPHSNWLDIAVAGNSLSVLGIGGSSIYHSMLEQVSIPKCVVTSWSSRFQNCYNLQSILSLDTSSGTSFNYMFDHCYSLRTIPLIDTSNGENFSCMFQYCYSLETIPLIDTSSGTDFQFFCQNCNSLLYVPALDVSSCTWAFQYAFKNCTSMSANDIIFSNATKLYYAFYSCFSLRKIKVTSSKLDSDCRDAFKSCYSLADVDFADISETISFYRCNLDQAMLVSIFNTLSTVTSETIDITDCPGASALTTAEREIATNKGWTITG